jgi:signal transduction histidine kinase
MQGRIYISLHPVKTILLFLFVLYAGKAWGSGASNPNYQKAWTYRSQSADSLFKYAQLAEQDGLRLKDTILIIKANLLLSECYLGRFNFTEARKWLDKAYPVAHNPQHPEREVELLNGYYIWYERANQPDSAFYVLLKGSKMAEKLNNYELLASVYNNLGNFFQVHNNTSKALFYLQKCLDIWEQYKPKNVAGILSDMGNLYYHDSMYAQAKQYYERALKVSEGNNDRLSIAFSAYNLAMASHKLNNDPEAEKYYRLAYDNYTRCNNLEGRTNTSLHLAHLYLMSGKTAEASQWTKNAGALALKTRNKEMLFSYYFANGQLAEKMHDFTLAAQSYKLGLMYQDSLIAANPGLKVSELKARFDLSEQQAENKQLKEQQARQTDFIHKQTLIIALVALLLIITVGSAWYITSISAHRKKIITQLQEQNELIEKQNQELTNLNTETLDQKQKLEENIAFKNKLFSIVSHDVRSPLMSLQGLLMLLSEDEDLSMEMLKPLLQDIAERVQVTSSFLDNLLSWAKSQLEGYRPELTELSLKKEVEEVIDIFEQIITEKHINVVSSVDENSIAVTDQNLLRLVLRNLLSNAIKFTHPGGVVEIFASYEKGDLVLSIKDNGVGMTSEGIRKVFEGKGYTSLGTMKEKGTGLGLSLCKDFIAQMNGKLWVESTPGKGSTFSFSVPASSRKIMVA